MNKKQDLVTEIPLSQTTDFPDRPFQVRDDESMNELVECIKERGLIRLYRCKTHNVPHPLL